MKNATTCSFFYSYYYYYYYYYYIKVNLRYFKPTWQISTCGDHSTGTMVWKGTPSSEAFFARFNFEWHGLQKNCGKTLLSSVELVETPANSARHSELLWQEYTGCGLPFALWSLLPLILQCLFSCSFWYSSELYVLTLSPRKHILISGCACCFCVTWGVAKK